MAIKKTLGKIVLYGTLLGLTGCSVNSQYDYNGKIGKDQVAFTNSPLYKNILTITKSDGKIIRYIDSRNGDLKLEYVDIAKNGQTERFDKSDGPVLKEAQKQFDIYLEQILKIKTQLRNGKVNRGLEDLK